MRSASQHSFAVAPATSIPRSSFRRTSTYKTTFDSGYLVPIYVDEALPASTHNVNITAFARLSTPRVPIMDNLYMDFFFFAVPLRLLWSNWVRLNGERDDPDDSTDYLAPLVTTPDAGWAVGSLSDYFGLPTGVPGIEQTAFWHRAYNLVWNEWFRDENLQDEVTVPTDDGPDSASIYTLLRRGKRHDYFTSCLPWPQKGPDTLIPLGDTAPVVGNGLPLGLTTSVNDEGDIARTANMFAAHPEVTTIKQVNMTARWNAGTAMTQDQLFCVSDDPDVSGLVADLSDATAATINSLRTAFAIQRQFELDARGGSRYFEILQSNFRVVSPDARMQRPEYLGGASVPVSIHSVTQTSSSDSTSPQGNLAAIGVAGARRVGFVKSFVEHCVILGLVSVRADLTYQQGIPRMFSRRSRFDWFWPALANLGEQAVLNKEIYATGDSDVDDAVFGYQERWAEYRYGMSKITGKLRSSDPQSLDVWHLSQYYESLPTLSAEWIEDNPPVARALAVQDEPQFIYDSLIEDITAQPMPLFSVPGLKRF